MTAKGSAVSGTARKEPVPPAPDRLMLSSLQSTHEHADSKAGILVAAQGLLAGTAGTWNGQAVRAWEHGGLSGTAAGALLVAFTLGLSGGTACLALALRPRLLRPAGPNRYS